MKLDRTSLAILTLALGLAPTRSIAQIVPDSSLPVHSIIAPNGNSFTINGGTQAGGNLFHSFQDFSLPTGTEAFFNNALDVQNIFSRVTGGNVSNIDGLLRANGGANLFLLNPAGIVFGPNARLDIGGSFFGTTANSIQFADGVEFSTTNPTATPLLTISVPIGLQFGTQPAPIQMEGIGHSFITQNFLAPIIRNNDVTGLQVQPGNTLALVGGDITLAGGTLRAESGQIELGSVGSGQVGLNAQPKGWTLDYKGVQTFQNIQLSQQALLDASGMGGGSIDLHGQHIGFRDGSLALIQNLGLQSAGTINVTATQSLNLIGTSADESIRSSLRNETLAPGNGGDITVSTQQLAIQEGGEIGTSTYSLGRSGDVVVNTTESLQVLGYSPITKRISLISAATFGTGFAGNLTLSTGRLTLRNAGTVGNTAFASGSAGNVVVNAAESIEVAGVEPTFLVPSSISSGTTGSGNAGQVTVNTGQLIVRDGGRIDSATAGSGSARSLIVNASELVEVSGTVPNSRNPSLITSSANILDPVLRELYQLSPFPTGESGDVTINTARLIVRDGAQVTVKNEGTGNAGTLNINTDEILLDRTGSLTASTQSGEGGNINLQVQEQLLLRQAGEIDAEAFGAGNGGNITINSPLIVGLENSNITANAIQGNGGNIQITTQGLFTSPDSSITASSQFGIDGIVTVNNPEVDPSSGLINFSQEVVDPTEQVVAGCQWTGNSEFIATGRGGIPGNPNHPLSSSRTWSDVRDLSEFQGETLETVLVPVETPERLVEATGWVVNENGQVELVATTHSAQTDRLTTSRCNPIHHSELSSPSPDTVAATVHS
jgi:filamentous hemagglutinin family protein